MNKYNSLIQDIHKILKIYKEFNPVIGGTASLYLQGCNLREPHDIDVFFQVSKEEFLDAITDKGLIKPSTEYQIDWNFFPNVTYRVTYVDGIPCQLVTDILYYKKEFPDVNPDGDCQKHAKDIDFISHWIDSKNLNHLKILHNELIDSDTEIKESFNKVVIYLKDSN